MKLLTGHLTLLTLCAALVFPAYGGTWRQEEGVWRYQDENGNDVKDRWVEDDGNRYYLDARGDMCTGWLNLDGGWYYLETDGRMATGERTIDGVAYTFRDNGLLAEGPGSKPVPKTAQAPFVTAEMCDADFWIDRYPAANRILLTPDEIADLNQRIVETPEANVDDLAALPETFDGKALVASMTARPDPTGLFLDGKPVPASYYEKIRANISRSAVSETMPLRYGFAVNYTVMKDLPCDDFLSDSSDDPEWDQLSSSGVCVNEPLAVYFFSGDGRYVYVRSSYCPGWIPAADVAVCESKAQWEDARSMTRFLVVTGDRIYLETSAAHPEASQKMLTMGTVLELDESGPNTSVDGRLPWYNYVVKLPQRNADGSFSQQKALIPANRDVSVGYLPFTVSNILTQAFKCLGDRYGWGGSLDAPDCSAFVRNVYRTCGLQIPRNTTWQAAMPVSVTRFEDLGVPEREEILRGLTPGSILQFPGHEMLYLGESGGRFYTINDVSSIVSPLDKETLTTIRPRSVIVNDMSTLRASGITWTEAVSQTIVVWE